MSQAIQLFNYKDHDIRILDRAGEPWMIAKEVCDILELNNITEALRGLDSRDLTSELLKSGGQNRSSRPPRGGVD